MNAKIATASTSISAAVTEIASLQPDNGVASVMTSNTAALKDAHTKVMAAQKNLVTARTDAGIIVKALASPKMSGSVSASGTTTVNP
jgi:hypothetical protein